MLFTLNVTAFRNGTIACNLQNLVLSISQVVNLGWEKLQVSGM